MSAAPLQDYSRTEKLLHWLALQPESVRRMSFDLERQFYLPDDVETAASGAVYVCGLARSGTTLVLQLLEQLPCFKSLTYRDMPFVLAPNLWRRMSGFSKRSAQLAERAHGDGVMVGYDSAESFEEVFWRTFSRSADVTEQGYGSCDVDDEALQLFAQYRALIANPRGSLKAGEQPKRYLSKNNDNLLRFDKLAKDPTATVLLVYRNPIDTALSLHRQHLRFMARRDDPFVARYMAWLGHHEFGPGHSLLSLAVTDAISSLKPDGIDYWLSYWLGVYSSVLERDQERCVLVNYDLICANPVLFLNSLFERLGFDRPKEDVVSMIDDRNSAPEECMVLQSEVLSKASSVYADLIERTRRQWF